MTSTKHETRALIPRPLDVWFHLVVVVCVHSPQPVCPVGRPVYKGCTEDLDAVNPFTVDTFGTFQQDTQTILSLS